MVEDFFGMIAISPIMGIETHANPTTPPTNLEQPLPVEHPVQGRELLWAVHSYARCQRKTVWGRTTMFARSRETNTDR